MVSSSKWKRETLVEHYRRIGTPTANETFDAEFDKEINAWAKGNVLQVRPKRKTVRS